MCKILLVEDNHKLRPLIVSLLDESGYSVVPAGTIMEAMTLLREYQFDLAIIDLKLPNGTGMDIIRHIRTDIPSIILTGHATHEARNEASTLGVLAFLEKPFNEDELVGAVMQAVDTGRVETDYRPPESRTREIGDEVDLQRLYSKMTVLGARVNRLMVLEDQYSELEEGQSLLAEQTSGCRDCLSKLQPMIDAVMERTAKCSERGEAIAVLQERARVTGINWDRVFNVVMIVVNFIIALQLSRLFEQAP